jgi:hypothetical protein
LHRIPLPEHVVIDSVQHKNLFHILKSSYTGTEKHDIQGNQFNAPSISCPFNYLL